jgi:hypothetical protein
VDALPGAANRAVSAGGAGAAATVGADAGPGAAVVTGGGGAGSAAGSVAGGGSATTEGSAAAAASASGGGSAARAGSVANSSNGAAAKGRRGISFYCGVYARPSQVRVCEAASYCAVTVFVWALPVTIVPLHEYVPVSA